jgi:NADPH2:quinone reductase
MEMADAGELRAVIERSFPLEQIVDAHRLVDTGHKRGSVVITVGARP